MTWKHLALVACVCVSPLAGLTHASGPLTLGEGRQPQLAVTAGGVFVAYARDGDVYFARSADRGETFGPPVEVASPRNMPVGMRRGPRIAAADDAIVITAISAEQGAGKDGDVVGWRSSDRGATWAALDAPLNRVPGAAREGLHAMAAGPTGQMFCAWLDLRSASADGSGGTEIWGARSADHGRTWSRDFLIYRSPEKSVCQCCHPSVAYGPDGTTVAVMFRNELSGNRDMFVVHSDDGGETFGAARKLGTGSWKLAACPMDGGMLAFASSGAAGARS